MADDVDQATEVTEASLAANIEAARGEIPEGEPGECAYCGEDMPRLVNEACAPCRDLHGLP